MSVTRLDENENENDIFKFTSSHLWPSPLRPMVSNTALLAVALATLAYASVGAQNENENEPKHVEGRHSHQAVAARIASLESMVKQKDGQLQQIAELSGAPVGRPSPRAGAGGHFISNAIGVLSGGLALTRETPTAGALTCPALSAKLRALPIVDIGAHDGTDYTIPAAKLGHRVYSYEPTPYKYDNIVKLLNETPGVGHTTSLAGFRDAPKGGVLLRKAVACSIHEGKTNFTVTKSMGGVGNSLHAGALPGYMKDGSVQVEVALTTLPVGLQDLQAEDNGVYLLKIGSQGHELHILRGALDYMKAHPAYIVFFEYYPKGLKAHGGGPLDLLTPLVDELGYTCFNARAVNEQRALTFEEFIEAYPVGNRGFGKFTDVTCVRLDLI